MLSKLKDDEIILNKEKTLRLDIVLDQSRVVWASTMQTKPNQTNGSLPASVSGMRKAASLLGYMTTEEVLDDISSPTVYTQKAEKSRCGLSTSEVRAPIRSNETASCSYHG